jgi:hypothetical protein
MDEFDAEDDEIQYGAYASSNLQSRKPRASAKSKKMVNDFKQQSIMQSNMDFDDGSEQSERNTISENYSLSSQSPLTLG